MKLSIDSRLLGEIVVLKNERFADPRGFFMEVFRRDHFQELGLPAEFVQDNHSGSTRGVLRGLHFQYDPPMGKLMRVTKGCGFLVAVDVRKGSPTLGGWFGIELTSADPRQVWAPAGFARGFCVLSDYCEIQYKCTDIYNSQGETSIRWNDPDVGIQWPVLDPILSDRDRAAQSLSQWLASPLSEKLKY